MHEITKHFLTNLIDLTKDYVGEMRHNRHIQFYIDKKEDGSFEAKFDYGRIGEGDFVDAICLAIGNAIRAVDVAIDEGTLL